MHKCVLIVEDDHDTRTVYADALQARGYSIIMASQGAEGVHLARRHRPDLILLDIRMPVMNGFEAMQYLRSYTETAEIPVCAISAYARDEDGREDAERLGFDCFLMKPIDPAEVVSAIENLIGPPVPGF